MTTEERLRAVAEQFINGDLSAFNPLIDLIVDAVDDGIIDAQAVKNHGLCFKDKDHLKTCHLIACLSCKEWSSFIRGKAYGLA